jgi:hypothetical protein
MKNQSQEKSVLSGENDLVNELGAATLTIESPDDVVVSQEVTFLDKAKSFVKQSFSVPDDETKTKSSGTRGRKTKTKPVFSQHATLVAMWISSLAALMIDEKWKEIAPSQEQSKAVIEPLLRIIDRHTQITEVNPDISDICLSLLAILAYTFEARASYILLKSLNDEKQKNDKRETSDFIGNFQPAM